MNDIGTTVTTSAGMIVHHSATTAPGLCPPPRHADYDDRRPRSPRREDDRRPAGYDCDRYDRRGGYYDKAPDYDYDRRIRCLYLTLGRVVNYD